MVGENMDRYVGRCVEELMDEFSRWICVWINMGNTGGD